MTKEEIHQKIHGVVSWLNSHYNQESEDYSIFVGAKPGVVRYDDVTAVSLWSCGAIVCIYDQLYFIGEDDGNWFVHTAKEDNYFERFAFQTSFSLGWANSFADALISLYNFVQENGEPVYFSGTDIICHYRLNKK